MTTPEILSYLVALLPAIYVGWWGRRLVRRLDDPLFPELYFKKTQRLGMAIAIGLVASLSISGEHAVLKLLLVIFTVTAADFPARKRIFRETWGLGGYLHHTVRFWIALLGVWILAALAPTVVLQTGAAAPAVAIALLVAVLLWGLFYARLFPAILGASPLEPPPHLEERFADVLAGAKCPPPRLLHYGPRGGLFVNAFALSSLSRPAVLFTDDLLAVLGPRETVAVFAHELGHLEHHDRRWLLRQQGVLGLFLAAVMTVVLYLGPASDVARILSWVWPILCLGLLAYRVARNQAHEHESDLRALELGAAPQAMIDALAKIHHLSRMPRRWAAGNERRMSHPSLVQRLRAIREAAGIEKRADDGGPRLAVRDAGDPSRAVLLMPDRLYWLSGLPADAELDLETAAETAGESRALPYADLVDLRLEGDFRRRRLETVDRNGRTTRLALRSEDVAVVKTAVERIDARVLGTAPELAPEIAARSGLAGTRVLAALATLFALFPPSTPVLALTTLLVAIRPARATLAAAGVVGLASAVLGWLFAVESSLMTRGGVTLALGVQALFGVVFLTQAIERQRRRYPDPIWTWWLTTGLLAVFATLSVSAHLLVVAVQPHPLTQLHLWIRGGSGAVLLLLGLAATLWTARRRVARLPALGLAAAALLLAATGTLAFRERFGDDPLGTLEPKLALVSGSVERVREIPVGGQVLAIALSPSGERLAYEVFDPDRFVDYGPSPDDRFVIEGPAGRPPVELACSRLVFLDDERVLTLTVTDDAMTLSLVRLGAEGMPEPVPAAEAGTETAADPGSGPGPKPAAEAGTESAAGGGAGDKGGAGSGGFDRYEIRMPRLTDAELRVDGERWEVHGTDRGGERRVRLAGRIDAADVRRDEWLLDDGTDTGLYFRSVHVDAAGEVLAIGNRYGGASGWQWLALFANVFTAEIRTLGAADSRLLAKTSLTFDCLDPTPGQRGFYCLASDPGHTQLWSIESESGRFVPLGSLAGQYQDGLALADGRLLLHGFDAPMTLIDPARGHASEIAAQLDGDDGDDGDDGGGLFDDTMIGFGHYFGVIATRGDLLAVLHEGDEPTIGVYRLPARLADERSSGGRP